MNTLERLKGKLVVSCQALEHEPLHSSEIMGKMALAAYQGGAAGIRANSVQDIAAIKNEVDLPIIGIIKQDYDDSEIFITATKREVTALLDVKPEIIAIDATNRKRPNNEQLSDLVALINQTDPEIDTMADVSTIEEAIAAEELGFSCVSTTLVGYTAETKGTALADDDFAFLRELKSRVTIPIVAEGRIDTPAKAARALETGADFIVVGSAITRPQLITETFVQAIQ
ncbi:N-acetylmannosamine-6-phosphate 2-epimerase [Amphibacillus sediminis]|uniref:N-acetylmannosamine-6-phosphate 2-epimerase n=1 Tax=Amphibacillus sediminis TaxID=360185 RepID=UPI0008296365|nr:N-acetylmannosamine-6-phosphate 2-epimerase [Amphibacillus sediminis]